MYPSIIESGQLVNEEYWQNKKYLIKTLSSNTACWFHSHQLAKSALAQSQRLLQAMNLGSI